MAGQNFGERMRQKAEAARSSATGTVGKPADELTDEQRKGEIEKLEWEVRKQEIMHLEALRRGETAPSSGRTTLSDMLREANRASRKRRR